MFRKLFSLTRFLPKEAWTFLRYIKIFKPLFLFVSLQICWRQKDFFYFISPKIHKNFEYYHLEWCWCQRNNTYLEASTTGGEEEPLRPGISI